MSLCHAGTAAKNMRGDRGTVTELRSHVCVHVHVSACIRVHPYAMSVELPGLGCCEPRFVMMRFANCGNTEAAHRYVCLDGGHGLRVEWWPWTRASAGRIAR